MKFITSPFRSATAYVSSKLEEPTRVGHAFRLVAGAICMAGTLLSGRAAYFALVAQKHHLLANTSLSSFDQGMLTIFALTGASFGLVTFLSASMKLWDKCIRADMKRRQAQQEMKP